MHGSIDPKVAVQMPTTLGRQELPLPADVAEWCPHAGCETALAVGTYKLDEASQQRLGRLHMFSLQPATAAAAEAAGAGQPPPLRLVQLSSLELPGIFDLRWNPSSAMPQLAAALADGSVRTIAFTAEQLMAPPESDAAPAPQLHAEQLDGGDEPGEGMAVSLDYSRCADCTGEQLAVSFSSGQLQLFQTAPAGMVSLATWQAHSLEAWAAATDQWHPSLVHSGGDDCAYRLWDSRQGFDVPAWQNSKAHGAGVCCVSSSPHQEHAVCTGSYDDHLRLWDLRAPHRPVLLGEVNTGGGVWRAKWHPTDPCKLLAACMYNGFAVLHVDGAARQLEVEQTYEHASGSLSYGADWCRLPLAEAAGAIGQREPPEAADACTAGSLVATCTFYDRLLHLWSVA